MRRIATAICVVGLAAFAVFALGAGGGGGGGGDPTYWVELDNAFGLIQGGDLKIAGVRAGTISAMKLDKSTMRALVQFKVTQNGFGSMRTDASCDTRPQSLIGEYYLNCQPGTAPQRLRSGSVIPVTQTTSTVGPDLIGDILRDPYRQRFSIILNEFGAAAAGNASELNAAVRRASPALRETDQVLGILGQQNRTLANLASEGDAVIGALSNNRRDVARWIDSSNRLASISAQRAAQIAQGFRLLPGFLKQLTPAMQALGQTAGRTTPALRNLDASATQLKTFLDQLGTFSSVSQPALNELGKASALGNQAVLAAQPSVTALSQFAPGVPELSSNLQTVLQHLDNRNYAVERDPRSAGGLGFTGLESLINYAFWQSTAINSFDANNHLLSVALFVSATCSPYPANSAVAAAAHNASNPLNKCISWLGPTQPGITVPDPTASAGAARRGRTRTPANQPAPAPMPTPAIPMTTPATTQTQSAPASSGQNPLTQTTGAVQQLLGGLTTSVQQGLGSLLGGGQTHSSAPAQKDLLDYLLGP
jgi:ABC-type transporter Mla subunit MlaD